MDSYTLEIKRAKNMIWSAARDYSFEPDFVGMKADGSADEYLNLVHGLVHKWLDYSAINGLFSSFSGENQELFEGLVWIGLEHAVYEKERKTRPVLSEMRLRYASENLEYQKKVSLTERLDLIHNGYFHEIMGQPSGLPPTEEKLLHDFLFDGSMTAEEICQKVNDLLWQHFSCRAKTSRQKKPAALPRRRYAFRTIKRACSGFIRISDQKQPEETAGFLHQLKMRADYLFDLSTPVMETDTFAYLEACFGKSMSGEQNRRELDDRLCTGNHRGLHLFFTEGDRTQPSGSEQTRREIAHYLQKSESGRQKNLEYDAQHRLLHRNAIARLRNKLCNAQNAALPVSEDRTKTGRINAARLWRAVCCEDSRVFSKRTEKPAFGFSVDILLDASSSREEHQEEIAAQGYILAESLTGCGIPIQVSSFLSIRDYTVIRVFRSYHQTAQNRKIFEYIAGGSNRDGLALRGISYLMESSPAPQKILILLTDANPCDDFCLPEGSRFKKLRYGDEAAVRDTAGEVRALKEQGVCVLGVFLGPEHSINAARQIFGKDFVRIQNVSQFADSVGNLLLTYLSGL